MWQVRVGGAWSWDGPFEDKLIWFSYWSILTPILLLCRVVYLWDYGSELMGRPMVLGHEMNLVIHHCCSLYSNLHVHSPICIHQSG